MTDTLVRPKKLPETPVPPIPQLAESKADQASVEMSMRRTGMSFQRTRLSADRTLMSVLRTSLSLIGFGFTLFQFFGKLKDSNVLAGEHAARNFGIALVALGIGMLALGILSAQVVPGS